jgi:hypothetical protein
MFIVENSNCSVHVGQAGLKEMFIFWDQGSTFLCKIWGFHGGGYDDGDDNDDGDGDDDSLRFGTI